MAKRITIILFVSILFVSSSASGFTIRTKNNKANKLFYKEEYKKALDLYDELDKSLTADGYIIYSGIPFDDRQRFLDFIEKKPYKIIDEISGDEWISYIAQRK